MQHIFEQAGCKLSCLHGYKAAHINRSRPDRGRNSFVQHAKTRVIGSSNTITARVRIREIVNAYTSINNLHELLLYKWSMYLLQLVYIMLFFFI